MISIVMTSYNRPCQLLETLHSIDHQWTVSGISRPWEIIVVDDGTDDRTEGICWSFNVKWVRLNRPISDHYRNQARPLNVGIRAAKGQIILLQNAECRHMDTDVIAGLTQKVKATNAVFAHVTAMNEDGTRGICYCGQENPRPYFFCGAIRREWFLKLRGFDEDYLSYGWEDDDMADRLKRSGVSFEFTDIEVEHQWHPPAGIQGDMSAGAEMFKWKQSTGVERNLGRGWGIL